MSEELLARLSQRLRDAESAARPITPLSSDHPEMTVADAYQIQKIGARHHFESGASQVGHKIGLTSRAIQEQLGVDQPDFGVITDAMVLPNRGEMVVSELIAPRVEAEFAFRIGKDLPPSPSRAELLEAIDGVSVALEVIDSRIADWAITLVDTVADNASSARVVVGEWAEASPEMLASLPDREISLSKDNEEMVVGPGSAVLGDPVESILWLAQAIGAYGEAFKEGQFVIAGAVAAAVPLTPHSHWSAQSDGLPRVKFVSI